MAVFLPTDERKIVIGKQLVCQKFIFKIHSTRLRKNGWDLTLPLPEARRNDEIISLADSQMLRWIDELNGVTDADARAREIKAQIKKVRRESNSLANKKELKKLYSLLDDLQFKKDYLCLIIDKTKDYYRAVRGFSINGVRYRRLLGTNGGIKNSTIVFVSERLHDELERRVRNDMRMDALLVTAKLEAYRALTCSASVPVSYPNGVLVVPDVETSFRSDIIALNDENADEPIMTVLRDYEVTINATDGCGMMSPALAERWSREIGLHYTTCGMNTRASFEKGMVFTFDFVEFAEKVAGSYLVRDAWGNMVDIRNVELILTTNMLKLWDLYDSCDDYLEKSKRNGYTFGIAKCCPEVLEDERTTNYQFIQGYELTDEDIDELIEPTMSEIRDVLGGDWRKTLLFLKGVAMNDKNILNAEDDYAKAIMINPEILNDPYIQSSIYRLIRNRINEAKVGVLKVHGNYSIVSCDPYLLCQGMFGMKPTGLLGAGEIYNKYWIDHGAEKLACFRAPMSCRNNIRLVHLTKSEEAAYWYRYMTACTVFNSWDTASAAMNGMD